MGSPWSAMRQLIVLEVDFFQIGSLRFDKKISISDN